MKLGSRDIIFFFGRYHHVIMLIETISLEFSKASNHIHNRHAPHHSSSILYQATFNPSFMTFGVDGKQKLSW